MSLRNELVFLLAEWCMNIFTFEHFPLFMEQCCKTRQISSTILLLYCIINKGRLQLKTLSEFPWFVNKQTIYLFINAICRHEWHFVGLALSSMPCFTRKAMLYAALILTDDYNRIKQLPIKISCTAFLLKTVV